MNRAMIVKYDAPRSAQAPLEYFKKTDKHASQAMGRPVFWPMLKKQVWSYETQSCAITVPDTLLKAERRHSVHLVDCLFPGVNLTFALLHLDGSIHGARTFG
jgi:hypothetical protein